MADILIIEDNDMLSQSYQMILEFHGHTVRTAVNGKVGLELADERLPDVILLDYYMPIMGGKQFLQKFDAPKKPSCKVILLTNVDEMDKVNDAYKLGIAHYLLKANVAPDELVVQVDKMLTPSK